MPSARQNSRNAAAIEKLRPLAEIGRRLSRGHAETWFELADGIGLRGRELHAAAEALDLLEGKA